MQLCISGGKKYDYTFSFLNKNEITRVLEVSKSTVCVWRIDSDLWGCCSASQGDFVSALLAGLQVWMTISRLQFVYFFIQRQGRSILIYRETESQMPRSQSLTLRTLSARSSRAVVWHLGVTPAPATLCCALGTELVSHFAFRAEDFLPMGSVESCLSK